MIFLKYLLLNFLFLFKSDIDLFNIAIFSIISLILVLVVEIYENKYVNFLISISYFILCLYLPTFRYFMFSFLYALYSKKIYYFPVFLIFLFPLEINFFVLSVLLILLAQVDEKLVEAKGFYDKRFLNFHKERFNFRKNLKNLEFEQERKKQEAILKERENISKNLHNSIGHTVSASILEIHALTFMTEDENMKNSLEGIMENLSKGMTEIREIIHNMYKSSFDFENEVLKVLDIPNVKTKFIIKIKNKLTDSLSFDILNIVKESFTNFLKHSNGDSFTVRLIENELFYILTIFDNGTDIKFNENDGLGLLSINEIAQKYGTTLNVITDNGFKLNITFKKGE